MALYVFILINAQAHPQSGLEPTGVDIGNGDIHAERTQVGDAGNFLALADRSADLRRDRGEHAVSVGPDMGAFQATAGFLALALEDIHLQLQGFQLGLSGFDEVAAVFFELLQFNLGALFLQLRLAQLLLGDCAKTL